jgi:exonuclease III
MPRASATIGRFPLPEPAMQIATWNVNSLSVRLPQVLDWLAAHPVDVLCLQELKLTDDKFLRHCTQSATRPWRSGRRPTTAWRF